MTGAPPPSFLARPGSGGAFGALMDEYARAAEDFCRAVEALSPEAFTREVAGGDPELSSIRGIALHVCGAAPRYADYVRKARGMPYVERFELDAARLTRPQDVRGLLRDALLYTEEAVGGLKDDNEADYAALRALEFTVRWGPRYDPEMILEHAIVHLLRHRRQIERRPI